MRAGKVGSGDVGVVEPAAIDQHQRVARAGDAEAAQADRGARTVAVEVEQLHGALTP
jgi:hypothetical protein